MKHSRISCALVVAASAAAASALLVACAANPVLSKEPAVDLTQPPANSAASDPQAGDAAPASESGLSAIFSKFDKPQDEGLVITDLQVGVGQSIQLGDMAKVHYVGTLADGKEFDSSRNRPGAFELQLGKGMVIRGFERGMVGMKIGGLRRISIPWQLAYGEAGSPPRIPPRANLVFEIELLDIPVPVAKPPPPKGAPHGAPPTPQ